MWFCLNSFYFLWKFLRIYQEYPDPQFLWQHVLVGPNVCVCWATESPMHPLHPPPATDSSSLSLKLLKPWVENSWPCSLAIFSTSSADWAAFSFSCSLPLFLTISRKSFSFSKDMVLVTISKCSIERKQFDWLNVKQYLILLCINCVIDLLFEQGCCNWWYFWEIVSWCVLLKINFENFRFRKCIDYSSLS